MYVCQIHEHESYAQFFLPTHFLSVFCICCHVPPIQIKSLAAYLGIAGHGAMPPCIYCTYTLALAVVLMFIPGILKPLI